MKYVFLFLFLSLTIVSVGKLKEDPAARLELQKALKELGIVNDSNISKPVIVKERNAAILIAEPKLFGVYGREHIRRQRPYKISLIDNYWIISGSTPNYQKGGTFLIIINATNSKVIKMSHGK